MSANTRTDGPPVILTVAMMRPGDKLASYRFLAEALGLLQGIDWRLRIVGDGPARPEVVEAFATLPGDRIECLGLLTADAVAAEMMRADLMAWPGFGEAYGLAYLEGQANGLPVVALDTAGVASTVRHGETGLLVDAIDAGPYAAALRLLLCDGDLRRRMSGAAAAWVRRDRTVASAASTLDAALRGLKAGGGERSAG